MPESDAGPRPPGAKIRSEDGVANALAFLNRMGLLGEPAAQ